jgi:gluconate kinase
MKESMLRSQIETLEEPADALAIAAGKAPREIVAQIQGVLGLA